MYKYILWFNQFFFLQFVGGSFCVIFFLQHEEAKNAIKWYDYSMNCTVYNNNPSKSVCKDLLN